MAAVGSGNPLDQRESKTGAILLVGDKGGKDFILDLRRNTNAVVLDLNYKFLFFRKAGEENLRCTGFKSVPEKIRNGLAKLYGIAIYYRKLFGKMG